jgi:hypothetical protein
MNCSNPYLPNEELELEMLEDLSLEIKSTKSDTKIKGLKADDYPTIPEIKEEKSFKINAKALEKAINENKSIILFTERLSIFTDLFKFNKDELETDNIIEPFDVTDIEEDFFPEFDKVNVIGAN